MRLVYMFSVDSENMRRQSSEEKSKCEKIVQKKKKKKKKKKNLTLVFKCYFKK